ncbi:hypothetical protein GDO81_000795 [Engystomops pustulosus]|uniref:Kappa-casein n=1 Tax=Engystomops pustulosus TaxID=76066 RepID=A0AAV7DBA0_ENGPU|nr:hypothetical protein GDO81_000795 [Engystomops pustulosus]KAG8593327.1 hypothetical protein GDO81_000795 [Engystomops pustulosus]
MKYMLVFALFLMAVYCYPRGKSFPRHRYFPKHGFKDLNKKYYPRYPSFVRKNCGKQPTLSTITRTPKMPVTTVQTSQESLTTAQYLTSPIMATIEKPDNARGDN